MQSRQCTAHGAARDRMAISSVSWRPPTLLPCRLFSLWRPSLRSRLFFPGPWRSAALSLLRNGRVAVAGRGHGHGLSLVLCADSCRPRKPGLDHQRLPRCDARPRALPLAAVAVLEGAEALVALRERERKRREGRGKVERREGEKAVYSLSVFRRFFPLFSAESLPRVPQTDCVHVCACFLHIL